MWVDEEPSCPWLSGGKQTWVTEEHSVFGYLVVGVVRGYPAVNEFGWGRSIVGCGYQVVGVVHGCPAVNNELGQGRTTVVCCYRVVGDSCAKAGQYPYSSTLVERNHKVGLSS